MPFDLLPQMPNRANTPMGANQGYIYYPFGQQKNGYSLLHPDINKSLPNPIQYNSYDEPITRDPFGILGNKGGGSGIKDYINSSTSGSGSGRKVFGYGEGRGPVQGGQTYAPPAGGFIEFNNLDNLPGSGTYESMDAKMAQNLIMMYGPHYAKKVLEQGPSFRKQIDPDFSMKVVNDIDSAMGSYGQQSKQFNTSQLGQDPALVPGTQATRDYQQSQQEGATRTAQLAADNRSMSEPVGPANLISSPMNASSDMPMNTESTQMQPGLLQSGTPVTPGMDGSLVPVSGGYLASNDMGVAGNAANAVGLASTYATDVASQELNK